MAVQKFNHLSSKYLVRALGSLTMTGSIANAYVVTEISDKGEIVINDASLTGNLTVTIAGSTAADGTSGFTVIKTAVFASATTNCAFEYDSEELSYAEDAAGVKFKSVVFRLTGTNTNTLKAAVLVLPLHRRANLTATGTATIS